MELCIISSSYFSISSSKMSQKLISAYCYKSFFPSVCMHKTFAVGGQKDQKTKIHQVLENFTWLGKLVGLPPFSVVKMYLPLLLITYFL